MAYVETLNASKTIASVNLTFMARQVLIENLTASWVYLRRGGTDAPIAATADLAVPPYSVQYHPVYSDTFGLRLGGIDAPSVSGQVADRAIIYFYEFASEAAIGEVSLINLAGSDQIAGYPVLHTFSGGGQVLNTAWIDLQAWSGVVFGFPLLIIPIHIIVTVSDDQAATFRFMNVYMMGGFISVPRTMRYVRLLLSNGPAGNVVAGDVRVTARRTLGEVAAYFVPLVLDFGILSTSIAPGGEVVVNAPGMTPATRIRVSVASISAGKFVTVEIQADVAYTAILRPSRLSTTIDVPLVAGVWLPVIVRNDAAAPGNIIATFYASTVEGTPRLGPGL